MTQDFGGVLDNFVLVSLNALRVYFISQVVLNSKMSTVSTMNRAYDSSEAIRAVHLQIF